MNITEGHIVIGLIYQTFPYYNPMYIPLQLIIKGIAEPK